MKLRRVAVEWGGKVKYLIYDENSRHYFKDWKWVKNIFTAERFDSAIAAEKIALIYDMEEQAFDVFKEEGGEENGHDDE